jgi:hypothetical protein
VRRRGQVAIHYYVELLEHFVSRQWCGVHGACEQSGSGKGDAGTNHHGDYP